MHFQGNGPKSCGTGESRASSPSAFAEEAKLGDELKSGAA